MKYNISIKNVQIQNVASIEGAEVNVEYGVGEIPEILSHLLPFIEKMAGEVAPKLANTFVEARLRLQREEEELRKERDESETNYFNKMEVLLRKLEASSPKHQEEAEEFPKRMSLEQMIDDYASRNWRG